MHKSKGQHIGKAPSLHCFHTTADAMPLDHISLVPEPTWEKDLGMGLCQYVDLCLRAFIPTLFAYLLARHPYIFVSLSETISTVLVSDVKLPCQMMLAISTESVRPLGVAPYTTISSF